MSKQISPTPTEYKGITYRSKCEAMFALHLDIQLREWSSIDEFCMRQDGCLVTIQGGSGFIYEPYTVVDGWNPDFLAWSDKAGLIHVSRDFEWIEYKPSKPTATYVRKFANNCLQWYSRHKDHVQNKIEFNIYYGNPYTIEDCDGCGFIIKPWEYDGVDLDSMVFSGIETRLDGWLLNSYESMMEYRFDLEQKK